VTIHYYFGPDLRHAVTPHVVDYLNPAIQVTPNTQKAVGNISVSLFLSAVSLDPVGDAEVRLYYGLPNLPATWYLPEHQIGAWPVMLGDNPTHIVNAPIRNCVWAKSDILWKLGTHNRIHNHRFVLCAVVICEAIHQFPTEAVPASDASVAVHNTLVVP